MNLWEKWFNSLYHTLTSLIMTNLNLVGIVQAKSFVQGNPKGKRELKIL